MFLANHSVFAQQQKFEHVAENKDNVLALSLFYRSANFEQTG